MENAWKNLTSMSSQNPDENAAILPSPDLPATPQSQSNWTLLLFNLSSGLYDDDATTDTYNNDSSDNVTAVVTSHNATLLNCDDWLEAQHVLFQLANMCFCVSFLTPNSFRFHLYFIRGVLTLGCLFMLIWGASVVCMVDILLWYLAFLIINLSHLSFLVCKLYPIHLHPTLEELYIRSFKPFKVSRYQFKELTNLAQIKELPAGAAYALETQTRAGQMVSVLLSGRLKVSHEKFFLHYIEPTHFVDSPEFEAVPPQDEGNDTFQVSISALEDSCLLLWPIPSLLHYFNSRSFMQTVFNTIVGKDITHKLYQVQELLLTRPDQLKVLASRNSLLHVRQRLSQSTSSHSLHVEMSLLSPHPSPAFSHRGLYNGNPPNGSPRSLRSPLSPRSPRSPRSPQSPRSPRSHQVPRATTPVGPYSPSHLSFETCV